MGEIKASSGREKSRIRIGRLHEASGLDEAQHRLLYIPVVGLGPFT